MPLQSRLLRTYSRRGGRLRLLPPPDRWISPTPDRKRFFSSTSAGSSAASAASSTLSSAPSDDSEFSPPRKLRLKPQGKRPWRLRSRGPAEKENRPPGPVVSSPSPPPAPSGAARRRRAPPRPLVGSAGQRSAEQRPRDGSAGQRPLVDRAEKRAELRFPQRPLLCSTPQCSAPQRRPRRRAPRTELSFLAPLSPAAMGLPDSPELFSPPRTASSSRSLILLESPQGEWEQPLPFSGDEGTGSCAEGAGRGSEHSPRLEKSRRSLRASGRRSCLAQARLSPLKGTAAAPAALSPVSPEAQLSDPCGSATSKEPCQDLGRDWTGGILPHQTSKSKSQLTPVVVLDPREVSMRLTSMKCKKKALQPACQQPETPLDFRGILENKRTKVAPGEGSTCRKACISGSSASRWGKQLRVRPKRLKNKTQQQPYDSFFRPQVRKKQTKKRALKRSGGIRDNDSSLLNTSHCWGRVQASLSFHKKKKITVEESFCNSILCTPSVKSQLSVHQATLSADSAQCGIWSSSSMLLLAPRNSCSVLELTLTDAEKVFGECQQAGPVTFEACIPLDKMKECKKIGEGVFGEVFQTNSERGPVALKIIPIEGTEKVNGEAQKSFGEILPEIIISKELSLLSEELINRTVGFISLYSVHCVQGAYPTYLLEAWDKYHQETGSENDRPDLFGDEQLFVVLEFEFGGSDLENMRTRLSSVVTAKSILHQVTASLAVAEQALHFEHRDLHWGNVLVKKTAVKELNYVLNGTTHTIPSAGIHVNIIDYTLSRLEKDGLTVFCDLSTDEELFQGTGDYQFDIYREMKAENSNNWTDYHPHSNVLWLHYLSDKLLKGMAYKKKESTSHLRKIKWQLSKFHKEVLTFESANEVLQKSSLFQ